MLAVVLCVFALVQPYTTALPLSKPGDSFVTPSYVQGDPSDTVDLETQAQPVASPAPVDPVADTLPVPVSAADDPSPCPSPLSGPSGPCNYQLARQQVMKNVEKAFKSSTAEPEFLSSGKGSGFKTLEEEVGLSTENGVYEKPALDIGDRVPTTKELQDALSVLKTAVKMQAKVQQRKEELETQD